MAKDMYQKRKERQENKKNETYEDKKTNINWYPGHMEKTKREIKERIKYIDLVLELVDARIPYSSKIIDIDDYVFNKSKIMIMTKKDLCDEEETNKWIKYYENHDYKVLLVDLNNPSDIKKIFEAINIVKKVLIKKRQEKGITNNSIKSIVIGIPNVGKSTLINRLIGKKVAKTENKPGVTKSLVWLKTKNNILLLDTPGILWPKLEQNQVALNLCAISSIKNELIPLDQVACHILNIFHNNYKLILKENYSIEDIADLEAVYEAISKKNNYRIDDYDRVSQLIINDLKQEKIKGVTLDRYHD